MKTTPAGPSILLWNGYVVEGDTFYQASYSVFDRSRELHFREIPKNSHLLEPYWNDRGTRTLRWFARGYYTVQLRGEEIDRKSTRLNSSHVAISYAVFCLKKKNK